MVVEPLALGLKSLLGGSMLPMNWLNYYTHKDSCGFDVGTFPIAGLHTTRTCKPLFFSGKSCEGVTTPA